MRQQTSNSRSLKAYKCKSAMLSQVMSKSKCRKLVTACDCYATMNTPLKYENCSLNVQIFTLIYLQHVISSRNFSSCYLITKWSEG